jgi:Rieske Fe-S protein
MSTEHKPTVEPMRRGFLFWLAGLFGAAAAAVLAIPFVGFIVGALRHRPVQWVDLGLASDFPVGETRLATFDSTLGAPWDGMTAHTGVYVRNEGQDQFRIFAVNCAHLGCPVTWFPQSGLFMCPCHGGVYYENGDRASGPPPRGLYQCVWELRGNRLYVQAPHYPTLQDTLRQDDA